ncbi:hypothetical protein ACJX0J_025030, partial [Zea mays]
MMEKLNEIVFDILEKSIIRGNLQYASLSALRRHPLDLGNQAFLHRAVEGNMTPEAALDHVRSIRPRVLLAPSQWYVTQVDLKLFFESICGE